MPHNRSASDPSSHIAEPLPTGFGRFTAIQDDHRALGVVLGKLRRACAGLQEKDNGPAFRKDALDLLTALVPELKHHFAREEHEEYFGVVVAERPALITRVAELRAEHTAFLEVVGALAVAIERGDDGFGVAKAILAFIADLNSHERRETQLLGEFFGHE